ncbi:putative bifunctional diguanylate cyclase/phosphodiesterase [Niallia oryzisoli]|uniref:putative bifunctional diguanylate cyclase/phosphodiesterase n=1 Tax=Niallia oryzisoli TaxID=1737571 RepID=UPI003736371E
MFFLLLCLIASIPLWIGITILVLFKNNNLSKVIFLFLLFSAFWQLDVSFLYAGDFLEKEQIKFLFILFRFGSIMVTASLFHIAYMIVQEELPNESKSKWRKLVNRKTLIFFYTVSFLAYLTSWSHEGVKDLELIRTGTIDFYFPVSGELGWIFNSNVFLFIFSVLICLLISKDVQNKSMRSFLINFNINTSIGYLIAILNLFPESRLYPSSITVMVFAIALLILVSRMHLQVVGEMNNKLTEQRKFLSQVIDLNPNYIYAYDQNGRYTLVNQAYANILGLNTHEMIGKTDNDIFPFPDDSRHKAQNETWIMNDGSKQFIREESITSRTGAVIWVQTSKIPIKSEESDILLAVSTDITERKQYEDEIKYQAYHDALTGLPNRRMFNEDLTNILAFSKVEKTQNAIMFLDLDRFKYINDTLGHDIGDLLLIEVSNRLNQLIEERCCNRAKVYRLGGDEFTILLPNHNEKTSEVLAKALLDSFKNGFTIEGSDYYVTPSIGISLFPKDGDDAKTLIKHADTAMYYVKEKGKNNYQLFTEEMHYHFYRKMIIEKQLRTALEKGEFQLHYQPIVDLTSNEIIAVESLLRWNNEYLGQTPPDEFISVAEETGMIMLIGKWVLKTALEQNFRWQKKGYKPIKVSVNVSVMQLLDPQFVSMVKNTVAESSLDMSYLILEVTESIAMYEAEIIIEKLQALKGLGIQIAMDDFGTGYSSLSYLKKYPLNSLKIDRSFVMDMNQDNDKKAIVKTIVAMAKQLDLKVIAEGVEGQEEYCFLSSISCDCAQGYGISKPLPPLEFEEKWLNGKCGLKLF